MTRKQGVIFESALLWLLLVASFTIGYLASTIFDWLSSLSV